jgi:hypothetical protein
MNDDPFSAERPATPEPVSIAAAPPESTARTWAARIGIGALTALALGLPLLFALIFYLALSDGVTVNGGDPLHEARLWMIREASGLTGIAWSISSPQPVDEAGTAHCARARVRYLKWSGGLRFEPDSDYCQCFEFRDGQWAASSVQCRVE